MQSGGWTSGPADLKELKYRILPVGWHGLTGGEYCVTQQTPHFLRYYTVTIYGEPVVIKRKLNDTVISESVKSITYWEKIPPTEVLSAVSGITLRSIPTIVQHTGVNYLLLQIR